MAFVHYTVKKIVHGLGAIKEAANEVKNLKGSKAFIVTDPGLAKIGVQKPLEEALTAGGIEWKLYAEAHRQVLRHQPGSESFPALHLDPHHVRHRL